MPSLVMMYMLRQMLRAVGTGRDQSKAVATTVFLCQFEVPENPYLSVALKSLMVLEILASLQKLH